MIFGGSQIVLDFFLILKNSANPRTNTKDIIMRCSFCHIEDSLCVACPECQEQYFFCSLCINPKTNLCPSHDTSVKSDMDYCKECNRFDLVYECKQCDAQNWLCEMCIDINSMLCKHHVNMHTKSDTGFCDECTFYGAVYECEKCDTQRWLCNPCNDTISKLCKHHMSNQPEKANAKPATGFCDWCHPLNPGVKHANLIVHPNCEGYNAHTKNVEGKRDECVNAMTATKHVYCKTCFDRMDPSVCILDAFCTHNEAAKKSQIH